MAIRAIAHGSSQLALTKAIDRRTPQVDMHQNQGV